MRTIAIKFKDITMEIIILNSFSHFSWLIIILLIENNRLILYLYIKRMKMFSFFVSTQISLNNVLLILVYVNIYIIFSL